MRSLRMVSWALLAVFTAGLPVCADEVDSYLRAQMVSMRIPGLGLAVVRDGGMVTARYYGLADLESKVPVTEESVFEIGSMTKQFTSAILMMLVEEGRVGLDDRLAAFLPETPEAWSAVTVRELLTHSSGIQEYLLVPGVFVATTGEEMSHDAVARVLFERLSLEFEPGETWSYSNSGYLLLGTLIERITGESYWENLQHRLFEPLEMTASRSSEPGAIIPGRVHGYAWRSDHFENRSALSDKAHAAGAIASSVVDMAKWEAALSKRRLLESESFDRMWTANRLGGGATAPFSYGFGWFIDTYHGRRVVWHSGGTPGFSSLIHRFVDDDLSIIVLTNHGDRVIDQLAAGVAGFFVSNLARPVAAVEDPDPATTARLREALDDLFDHGPELQMYTPAMQVFLGTGTGRAMWEWLAADGPLESWTYRERERVGEETILRYQTLQGGVDRWYSFTLAQDGRIAQVKWW